jgi:hypothetical protein
MIGIGKFGFDLAIPFEAGGMDTSGFTVAPGMARARPSDDQPRFRRTGFLATCFWMVASALLGRSLVA